MPKPPKICRTRHFSLVELMVAILILVIMVLMLAQLLVNARQLMDINNANARIYENARLAFDLLERDLRCSYVSNLPDRTIAFHLGDPDVSDDGTSLLCTFVTSNEPLPTANSRLSEVSYRFHQDQDPDNPEWPPNTLLRQQVFDNDANWDFLGAPTDWHINETVTSTRPEFEPVIRGVTNLNMQFLDDNASPLGAGMDVTETPTTVEITLTLFDEDQINAPPAKRFQTQRVFTKIVYLGDLNTAD